MIYNDVELFNVEETEEFDGGVILQRFTKAACHDTQYSFVDDISGNGM